jgi:hypothetical protein
MLGLTASQPHSEMAATSSARPSRSSADHPLHRQRRHQHDHIPQRPIITPCLRIFAGKLPPRCAASDRTACAIALSATSSMPTMNPFCRMSPTCLSDRNSCSISANSPLFAARRQKRFLRINSSDATAAAHASGLPGVRVAVEKCLPFPRLAEKRVEDFCVAKRRRQRQISAADSLGDAHQIRLDVFMLAGEHFPVRPNPTATSSAISSTSYARAHSFRTPRKKSRRLNDHPPRPLHDRLNANRRDLRAMLFQNLLQRFQAGALHRRRIIRRFAAIHIRRRREMHRETASENTADETPPSARPTSPRSCRRDRPRLKPTNSHFSGRPMLCQYCAASLNAISVAVAPLSL